ncbi:MULTISPECIES: Z1 domain-containing protein [Oceanobacillus]|uniref:Z1 domain-containing protein n=1 Tax=Oceanobacillus aidingensis TaxID=645964 RepID=A0ABV9JYW1_9BACI|nr:Z1 domain-containing protein [Oceanobacillus oncorhynchi]MDM8099902.1 Z1 domain-containing protein [Oceanobacillus oncorhynchi]
MHTAGVTSLKTNGTFFPPLIQKNNYKTEEIQVMQNTVSKLLDTSTTSKKPGMLLGHIQSGKTRSFLGSMGLGFDNGFEVVIILTKNSNALVKQTFERVESEFTGCIEEDELAIYDIMKIPVKLRKFELKKKLVIVLKKEKKNMQRLERLLFDMYPVLTARKMLFIDDEADFASVAYDNVKDKNIIDLKVIAGQIDQIRARLENAAYLQVTATPYSLYLQPDDMNIHEHKTFQPKRPAFTELVPVHDKYVGGEMYFEKSNEEGHMASCLYHEIQEEELEILRKSDKRKVKVNHLLNGERYEGIRSALIHFIVGSKIRNIQQQKEGERLEKYAFIMHTITTKAAHQWQEEVMLHLEEQLREAMEKEDPIFDQLIRTAYQDFARSQRKDMYFPAFDEVLSNVRDALIEEELLIEIVNSEQDVDHLLDKSGELKLRTPLNFFIGGQILDRGITIKNLIGFYYGRNPQKFQQDTVLQHSRMYGARPLADMAVTRFYTTRRIYDVMEQMHEFDTELRRAFESGANSGEVTFIQKDSDNTILPCNPNKILLSSVQMLKPGKRMLPSGFQTIAKSYLEREMKKIAKHVATMKQTAKAIHPKDDRCFLVEKEKVQELLEMIYQTYVFKEGYEWDLETYGAVMNYLSEDTDTNRKGHVWVVLRQNRNMARIRKSTGRFEDAPDTKQDELKIARNLARIIPSLILIRQNGAEEQGWRGGAFYWPVLVTPEETKTTVFAGRGVKER